MAPSEKILRLLQNENPDGETPGPIAKAMAEVSRGVGEILAEAKSQVNRDFAPVFAEIAAEYEAAKQRHNDSWLEEFGEPFPDTIEEWSAFQIRIKMGSGRTFSDDASGDEMWGIIEGYLKGLKERPVVQTDRTEAVIGDREPKTNLNDTVTEVSKESRALIILLDHPDWTDAEIAKGVPCNRTSLYRFDKFNAARSAQKATAFDSRPKGSKYDGNLEAEA